MPRRFEKKNGARNKAEAMTDESETEPHTSDLKKNGDASLGDITVNERGLCTFCGKHSVCKCERCGDFYCSPMCQRKDWPNHRFICFPLPRLVKAGQQEGIRKDDFKDNVPVLKAETKAPGINKDEKRSANKSRVEESTPLPDSGSCVIITCFRSSNRCFIRSANPSITQEYQTILKTIDNFGKESQNLSGLPKPNSYAIAQLNGKWRRVKILAAKAENNVRVRFVDYGTISIVNLKDLRRISQSLSAVPCYINMVQLHGVTHVSQDTNMLKKLLPNVEKEFRIEIIEEDEMKVIAKLYHWGTKNLLNLEILNLCHEFNAKDTEMASNTSSSNYDVDMAKNTSTKGKSNGVDKKSETPSVSSSPSSNAKEQLKCDSDSNTKKRNVSTMPKQIQMQKPCLEPPFETIPLDTKDSNVKVYVVDCSYIDHGYIGCLLDKNCENLKSIAKFLNEYNDNGQAYKPKLNEYCLAKFEDEWYRAKVIDVLGGDNYQVVYIDFSNELQVTSDDIRRYPMSLTVPCCTSLCAIEDIPNELSDEVIEFLKKNYYFQTMAVDHIKIEEGITFVKSKEVIKRLRDAKLI